MIKTQKTKLGLSMFIFILILPIQLSAQIINQYLWPGKSVKVEVNASAGYSSPTWTTSNPTLALEGSGFYRNVTATAYFGGVATVSCTYKYSVGNTTYTNSTQWNFACNDTGMSIYPTSINLSTGDSQQLSWSFDKTTYLTPSIYFNGYDPSIIAISSTGLITARAEGTTTIYVSSNIGTGSATCNVMVKDVLPTSIDIQPTMTVAQDSRFLLTPTLSPSGAKKILSWSTSDNTIVSHISSGEFIAKECGVAVVTVSTHNNLTATCEITVVSKSEYEKLKENQKFINRIKRIIYTNKNLISNL